jgi:hypothetical protein
MAKTKTKQAPKTANEQASADAAAGQLKLDDRTSIDDLKSKKTKKEELPKGFKRRLPAGVRRMVKVNRHQLDGNKDNKPVMIYEDGKLVAQTDKMRIEGESDMVCPKIGGGGCGPGRGAHVETDAAILIGKE